MDSMIEWLAEICKQHLLHEKWLIAQDLRTPQQWMDRIALSGASAINLHSKTIRTIALSLSSDVLAKNGLSFANSAISGLILQKIISDFLHDGQLEYFDNRNNVESLSELISKSIRDLQLSGVSPAGLDIAAFDSPAKGRDILRVFDAYHEALTRLLLIDYTGCLGIARHGVADSSIPLPADLMVVIPQTLELFAAERGLLEALESKAKVLGPDFEAFDEKRLHQRIVSVSQNSRSIEYFSGFGEINEVRGVSRRILNSINSNARNLDTNEILYTDYAQYVPLILESLINWLSDIGSSDDQHVPLDRLPATFAEGIACVYSRPGRALRCWIRWAAADFVQTRLVQLVREGLLERPDDQIGYARLASALGNVPIGFNSERYAPQLEEAIASAMRNREIYLENKDAAMDTSTPTGDFGVAPLESLRSMVKQLIDLAPKADDLPSKILNKARLFLLKCVKCDSKLDRLSRNQMIDDINGMLAAIRIQAAAGTEPASADPPSHSLDVRGWLEDLATNCFVMASGPMPGCVHVAPLASGGHSGRPNLYVVGLDDGRYPPRCAIDPILMDSERSRLSHELPTSAKVSELRQNELGRVLFRHLANANSRIVLSFSTMNLSDERIGLPSNSLIELFRKTSGNASARMDDLLHHLGLPDSFASSDPNQHLTVTDQVTAMLLGETDESVRKGFLSSRFEHIANRQNACVQRAKPSFGEFDGYVPLAGRDLDPQRMEHVSASWLEYYGACPRKFLFRKGLKIYPPDEWQYDPETWLSPMEFGSLVHTVFETFLGRFAKLGSIPDYVRDRVELSTELFHEIQRYKQIVPVPSLEAYHRQSEVLEELCDTFLYKEANYCKEYNAIPWVLESAIGGAKEIKNDFDYADPVKLTLNDGRSMLVHSRIDRIDKTCKDGSHGFAIWDYKSGGDFGYKQSDPFGQGRLLQPFLYVSVLRHRLRQLSLDKDAQVSFGYFFPNPKTAGLRLSWTHGELKLGDEILQNICTLISNGVFIATSDDSDCKYCDYQSVCGEPKLVALESRRKVVDPTNDILEPFRELREHDV